jgi:hypothetical protein
MATHRSMLIPPDPLLTLVKLAATVHIASLAVEQRPAWVEFSRRCHFAYGNFMVARIRRVTEFAIEIGQTVGQYRRSRFTRLPAVYSHLIPNAWLPKMRGYCQVVLPQYIDGTHPACLQQLMGVMLRINAERDHKRIERNLHDPGGGEGILFLAIGNGNDVNAVSDMFKYKTGIFYHGNLYKRLLPWEKGGEFFTTPIKQLLD